MDGALRKLMELIAEITALLEAIEQRLKGAAGVDEDSVRHSYPCFGSA